MPSSYLCIDFLDGVLTIRIAHSKHLLLYASSSSSGLRPSQRRSELALPPPPPPEEIATGVPPARAGFYLPDNLDKLFRGIFVLTLDPFVCAEHGCFLCNLWRREVNLVITEQLDDRTNFCSILCQLLQFLLLYQKFTRFVIQLRLVLCNDLLYIRLLCLIFVKSYFAGCKSSFIFLSRFLPAVFVS